MLSLTHNAHNVIQPKSEVVENFQFIGHKSGRPHTSQGDGDKDALTKANEEDAKG